MKRRKFIHLPVGNDMNSYRVNEYEFGLLKEIMSYEGMASQAEALRMIIREAASARGLHPVVQETQEVSDAVQALV